MVLQVFINYFWQFNQLSCPNVQIQKRFKKENENKKGRNKNCCDYVINDVNKWSVSKCKRRMLWLKCCEQKQQPQIKNKRTE